MANTTKNVPYAGCVEPMSTIGALDLMKDDDNITHMGWVYKRSEDIKVGKKLNDSVKGKIRNFSQRLQGDKWKNFYVIIHKACIYIYFSEKSKKPKHTFSLNGYKRVMRAEDVSSPYAKSYVFKLIHFSPDKRTWYFATASEREMQLWMATIKSELEKMSNNGHVSHLTQKLVIGLKRPSFRASEVSDFDDDDIYKDIETAVVYDYNDIDDSGADESDSDYESPVEEAEDSIGNRPLPPTPADSSSNSSPMSRPPAQIPAAEKTWKPPGGVSCGFHMGGMNELKNRQMDMNDKKNSNEVSFGVKSKLQNAWPPLPTPPTSKPKIPSSTKPAIPIKNVGGPPKPAPRPRQSISSTPDLLPAKAMLHTSDKMESERCLNKYKKPGMYLVRKSSQPGVQVLVVYDAPGQKCLHYKVFNQGNEMYLLNTDPNFNDIKDMLEYYYSHPLPTTSQHLTEPYLG